MTPVFLAFTLESFEDRETMMEILLAPPAPVVAFRINKPLARLGTILPVCHMPNIHLPI